MSETVTKAEITLTVKIIHCKGGGYVGSMQEIPIVVQADNIKELNDKLAGGLREHIVHHQQVAIPPMIEISA